jgi:DNA-binding winged helix-turn-helix (wHTH) protein
MNASKCCVYEFGEFHIDSEKRVLLHNGEVVPLTPKVFETLIQLVQHQGEILKKDELMRAIWPDTVVEENNLNQNISALRRVFKELTGNDRYILTIPGTGYRFVVRVAILNGDSEQEKQFTPVVPPEMSPIQNGTIGGASHRLEPPRRKKPLKLGIAVTAALFLLVICVAIWKSQPRPPIITNVVRITNDRKAKIPINGAVTDGLHLYFIEGGPGSGSGIAQVSAMGGETTWIATSLKDALAILDISPDKSKLLLVAGPGGGDSDEFWVQPLPAGTPRRVGNLKARGPAWTPDGSHIIYSYQHKIAIVNEDGSDPHTIAEIPGSARWFRYSPDGRRIRFSLLRDMENSSSLWEMRADGTNLHQLLPNWKESLDQCCGKWSPDGNYYYFLTGAFFLGGGGPSQGIWVMPEYRSIFRQNIAPTRLTTGPLRFGAPTPSSDGKRIFAVGDESRVELFSYDPHAQRFDSYLGGLSAGPVALSPD